MDATNFECYACNFKTDKKYNYQQHMETIKHKELTEFKCDGCGNFYKHDSSLARHRRNCAIKESEPDNSVPSKDDITEIIASVVETNNQFQNKILETNSEFMKSMIESNKTTM